MTPPLTIRRATYADIHNILNLLSQVNEVHHIGRPDLFNLGTKYNESQLTSLISDNSRPIFVATAPDSPSILGYCFCIFEQILNDSIRTPVKTLYIDDLCVDANHRGQHIGRALFAFVKDFARSSQCYNLTLHVWSCNLSAQRFYESLGLKPQMTSLETIL